MQGNARHWRHRFTPSDTQLAAINLGKPVLAKRHDNSEFSGVSVVLAENGQVNTQVEL